MKQTISNVYQFRDAFAEMGRKDNFSYEGLEVLFDYLEELEDSIGEQIECDVIGFCCDYSEDTWQDIAKYYSIELDPSDDDETNRDIVGDWLSDEGMLVGRVGGSFVYRNA